MNRIDYIMKALCATVFDSTREMAEYMKCMEKTAKALTTISMYKAYMMDNGRVSWDSYRKMIEHHIEEKCKEIGRQMVVLPQVVCK